MIKLRMPTSVNTPDRQGRKFRDAVKQVVADDNCTGCGLCAALSDQIEMRLDQRGYLRPAWVGSAEHVSPDAYRRLKSSCPGISVTAATGPRRHATMGSYVSVWSAWAINKDVRHAGSSAGVITALSKWLIESGRVPEVLAASASATRPTRTVPVILRTGSAAQSSAGSRYAPVGVASMFSEHAARSGAAFVGKPCEAYAVRRAATTLTGPDVIPPLVLSFFCAGVPSQDVTEDLVERMSAGRKVRSVRYRGNGWPGKFAVHTEEGTLAEMDYEESWGRHLGPRVQSRCKICPDGTGEHADIAIGDFWSADAKGYPIFTESEGMSVAIARTPRGHDVLMDANMRGIIGLKPVDLDDVAAVQPLQVHRRRTVLPRLVGRLLAGQRVPRVRGYQLLRTEISTAPSLRGFLIEFRSAVQGSRTRATRSRRRRRTFRVS